MNQPWCPWCFDGQSFSHAAAEVKARITIGLRVVSWECNRCCVVLSSGKWALAMMWAARFHGLSAEEVAPDIERARGAA